MLNRISIGWVWLARTLNAMIDAINQQKPLGSASIVVEESPNGSLLKVVASPGGDGGGEVWDPSVGWQPLTVIDPTDCSQHVLYYWGTPPDAPQPAPPQSGASKP